MAPAPATGLTLVSRVRDALDGDWVAYFGRRWVGGGVGVPLRYG